MSPNSGVGATLIKDGGLSSELPPDLAEWKVIHRDGKMFAVSRHGGTHTYPDDPSSIPELIACARRAQSFALAFDPVTNQRRSPILDNVT